MLSKVRAKRILASFVVASAVALYAPAPFAAAQSAEPSLDYEFFKTRVEPIFLKKRSADHARCYVCHVKSHHVLGEGRYGPLSLEPLSPGTSFWTEEQSRLNFQAVSILVVPGAPQSSMILIHPLAPEAGGTAEEHAGGKQFASKDDPDWKTIEAWIRGEKAGGSSDK